MKRPEVAQKVSKALTGEKNPLWGKKHKSETIELMKTTLRKHHVYLKENSDEIILLTTSMHLQLHKRAYGYIYFRYGKEGINDFLKWFDEKYGLKEK
jgi:hypothetical protein